MVREFDKRIRSTWKRLRYKRPYGAKTFSLTGHQRDKLAVTSGSKEKK